VYARFFYRLPNLPRCTQRSESSQISPRQCSFLLLSSLFFEPLTIATSYEFTWSAWSAIKWPTRETDVLDEIASINFFAVVNDLKRWCKKVECIYGPSTCKIQLLLVFARYNEISLIYLYLFPSAIRPLSKGSFQWWRLKEIIGKGTVQTCRK